MCEYVSVNIVYGWQMDYGALIKFCDKVSAPEMDDVNARITPYLPVGMTCERVFSTYRDETLEMCDHYLVLKKADKCTLLQLVQIDTNSVWEACGFMRREFGETREPIFHATAHHN